MRQNNRVDKFQSPPSLAIWATQREPAEPSCVRCWFVLRVGRRRWRWSLCASWTCGWTCGELAAVRRACRAASATASPHTATRPPATARRLLQPTSTCSTDSNRPHRCCHLPNNFGSRQILLPFKITPFTWGSGPPPNIRRIRQTRYNALS